jgi:drug/metabolite transporter (DMT)-like permease
MNPAVAVVAALVSAMSFGIASVVQQYAASKAPGGESLRLALLLHLARQPLWLAGMVLTIFSFVVQGVALAFGPLVLVQPVAATDLVFALPLLAWRRQEHLTGSEWVGIVCTAGGVAAFLAVLPPGSAGTPVPTLVAWLPTLACVGAAATVLAVIGLRAGGKLRSALYATSAAVLFSLLDSLTKSTTGQIRADGVAVLRHWEPYAMLAVGITALVLSQSAFQAGSLAVSLPIIDTLEPMGAVLIGIAVFDEQLAASPPAVLIQAVAAGVAVLGIVLLALSPLARAP